MKLVITVCATENYCYAMKTLGRRVVANLAASAWATPGVVVIAGDRSLAVKAAVRDWRDALPPDWEIVHLGDAGKENAEHVNYKTGAQTLIARLRGAAFTEARRLNADLCWSLDSDTLPPANALRCMVDMLKFDDGYYQISTCPYPNEMFLGGHGTPQNPIAEDFLDSERVLTDEVKAERDALKKEVEEATAKDPTAKPTEAWLSRKEALNKKIRECPPDGNIFQVNGKHGWRRRGWLDHAYPAIGKGAVVPTDWCGFGCTLMGREALALANFEGYDGQGTEDLYIVWRRWWPAGLRLNVIPHCPCDHVIWSKKKGGKADEYVLIQSLHETQGECIGHLRTTKHPWTEL